MGLAGGSFIVAINMVPLVKGLFTTQVSLFEEYDMKIVRRIGNGGGVNGLRR